MTGRLKLRDITPGRALVCDRASGFPLAALHRRCATYRFPGHGTITARTWTAEIDGHEIAADTTRAGCVAQTEQALIRRGLLLETRRQ